jgi:hypothetical protein
MAQTLFGDEYTSPYEIARKIVTKGYSEPFYKIRSSIIDGVSVSFHDEADRKVNLNRSGLYAIYRQNQEDLECLYVGKSDTNISYRVYRFIKELCRKSRKDESHSGGKKARMKGVRLTDNLLVKVVSIDHLNSKYQNLPLDEYAAVLLKSRFNKRRKV